MGSHYVACRIVLSVFHASSHRIITAPLSELCHFTDSKLRLGEARRLAQFTPVLSTGAQFTPVLSTGARDLPQDHLIPEPKSPPPSAKLEHVNFFLQTFSKIIEGGHTALGRWGPHHPTKRALGRLVGPNLLDWMLSCCLAERWCLSGHQIEGLHNS